MKFETLYRYFHDHGIPCQHCGKKINWVEAVAVASMLHDGRVDRRCPHCRKELPQAAYRDYGVKRSTQERVSFSGLPENNGEWIKAPYRARKPLWALRNEL